MLQGWYGVDLDGTLAEYDHWKGADHIGAPIPAMIEKVKKALAEGKDVRIFTARVWPLGTTAEDFVHNTLRTEQALTARRAIVEWCKEHLGCVLPITCVKDYGLVEMWDDRAKQVIPNTGMFIEEQTEQAALEQLEDPPAKVA